ncbi:MULTISPECIES: hypothetical protein [unclassified Cytobacillus]|uniref:hypothetical protein n=1 Tax=unclassified Cytobacillus TaxID=2675268 RepID=UPI0013FCB63E|nr:hypothetical protein [Cytobacillus sp. AMY 15.2]KAF0818747.1 hypothetical protein KIS4809_2455 [Bacillus sp. ZZV12-4809]MCM3091255.1 hypothetical protein [Cytobacillus sp. AMY 15.2]
MKHSSIDFNKISQALNGTLEAIQGDGDSSREALESIRNAQDELQQALSFSMSRVN